LANSDFPINGWKFAAIRHGNRWDSFLVYQYKCGKNQSYEKCTCMGWIPARSPRPVYGSPAPVKVVRKTSLALRAGGSVCGSTVDSARRAKDVAG